MGSFYNRRLLSEYEHDHEPITTPTSIVFVFSPPIHIDVQPQKTHHLSFILIIIIAILGGCFLLVSYYAIIVKYCSNLNTSRRPQPQVQDEEDFDVHENFLDEIHGPVVDHPIWYIHTVGLAQSVIDSITAFKYKKGEEGFIEGTDCSVCLSEFEDGEILRLLPKCSHAFHLSCIDPWLRSHTNCPSCRAPIVAKPVVSVSPTSNSGIGEEVQGESSGSDGGLENDQNEEGGASDSSVLGVQDEGEEHDKIRDIVNLNKDLHSCLEMSEFRVFSDLSDNHRVIQNGKQPVRRSASMDVNPASIFCFSMAMSSPLEEDEGSSIVQLERGKEGNISPGIGRLVGSSSKGKSRSPISMKRSFSSGAKLVLSRSSRNRSSILPL